MTGKTRDSEKSAQPSGCPKHLPIVRAVTPCPQTTRSAALEELYRREWARSVRMTWLLVGSRAVAEDLVHDAFVQLNTCEWPRDPPAYLRSVLVNLARGFHRRTAVENKYRFNDIPTATAPEFSNLLAIINRMPSRQRTAMVLRFYCDLSFPELARELDCPVGTAKSLVHRGVRHLRREVTHD